MQIHIEGNQGISTPSEGRAPLKEGQTLVGVVKEKVDNNEALVQIRGQDMRVRYEGNLPNSGHTYLQIQELDGELPVVKVAAPPVLKQEPKLSHVTNDAVRQALQMLNEKNVPITREAIHQLNIFFERRAGTTAQKLDTLAHLIAKKLPITEANLTSIHEALHGESLSRILKDLGVTAPSGSQGREMVTNFLQQLEQVVTDPQRLQVLKQIQQMASTVSRDELLQQLLSHFKEEIHQHPNLLRNWIFLQPPLVEGEGVGLVSDGPTTPNFSQQALEQVQKNPHFNEVLQFVREGLREAGAIEEALSQAEELYQGGRELAARQVLATSLQALTEETKATPGEESEVYRFNQEVLASLPIESRNMIVTTITKKLSQAALDFKQIKRDISNALFTVERMLQQVTPSLARPSLEMAIKQLDQAILKSDFMLYTDMTTEKQLLQASTDLHEAKKLMQKGETGKAWEIVHRVRETIDKIIFRPADVRVKHMVAKEILNRDPYTPSEQIQRVMTDAWDMFKQEPTPRATFEYMRTLGLTHEGDLLQQLAKGQEEMDVNVKQLLMKLAETQARGGKAEQAVQNLTGQQLLSKPDSTGIQTLMFTLPLLFQQEVGEVKVFIKGKQGEETLDWENCSLYFLLETKTRGDVGILLRAVDRNLSITLRNDSPDFERIMTPLINKAKDRLEEIGYQLGSIHFSRLTEEEPVKREAPKRGPQPAFTENGYDFSV